ncbi:hypothetical protein HQ529_06890 [Candidatus Woesearchaeota archaeon]|nr:hypothetical protein [Candidatus Woesearchaeota archaeon]
MDEIDPEAGDSEEWQNEYLIWLYSNNKEKFDMYIEKLLEDVEIIDGVPNLIISTQGEFAQLFCDNNRNDIPVNTIESILDGEYDNDYYYDLSDDIYGAVIEELTKENLKRLKEYIIETLNGQKIVAETEVLELISQQQGRDYVIVDESNIDEIVDDKETMIHLMDDELMDLRNELSSIYHNSYNTAYDDDLYDSVWNELDEFFERKGEWVSRPHTYKSNTEVQYFKTPIHNFYQEILNYLNDNKTYGHSGLLQYHGSYLSLLKEDQECLSVYAPDYPDSRKVDKNINSYFTDYI